MDKSIRNVIEEIAKMLRSEAKQSTPKAHTITRRYTPVVIERIAKLVRDAIHQAS